MLKFNRTTDRTDNVRYEVTLEGFDGPEILTTIERHEFELPIKSTSYVFTLGGVRMEEDTLREAKQRIMSEILGKFSSSQG